jgi:hypothetical protein
MPGIHSLDTSVSPRMAQDSVTNGINGHVTTANGINGHAKAENSTHAFNTIEESIQAFGKSKSSKYYSPIH